MVMMKTMVISFEIDKDDDEDAGDDDRRGMPIDWGLDLNAHAPDSNPVLIFTGEKCLIGRGLVM